MTAVVRGGRDTARFRGGLVGWGEQVGGDRKAVLRQRTALGRIGGPQEVAAAVSFLIGEDARFITGTVLVVDGGASARLGSE